MEQDWVQENRLLEQAICFATNCHRGQLRKGTHLPYIFHPLEAMLILRSMGADTALLMAGVLHDVIEDTEATADQVLALFGEDVAALVCAHTEDKSQTWEERRRRAIAELADAPLRLKMLILADKVSNLRSMAADYPVLGRKLWDRFAAPREKQTWYYGSSIAALEEMAHHRETAPVYQEMRALYKQVFEL